MKPANISPALRGLIACLALLCLPAPGWASDPATGTSLDASRVSWLVKRANQNVSVQWQLPEANAYTHIAIEKTIDQREHALVAMVPGKPGQYTVNYTFWDTATRTDSLWLRLQLTSADGKRTYTPYVFFPPVRPADRLNIYPMPGNGREVHLSFDRPLRQDVRVTIEDPLGKVYYSRLHPADRRVTVRFGYDLPALAAGLYHLTAESEEYFAKQVFVVQ